MFDERPVIWFRKQDASKQYDHFNYLSTTNVLRALEHRTFSKLNVDETFHDFIYFDRGPKLRLWIQGIAERTLDMPSLCNRKICNPVGKKFEIVCTVCTTK